MKRLTAILFFVAVGLLFLSGCDTNFSSLIGRSVRFSAASGVGMQTKTQYSGSIDGGFERIEWVVGDQIRIFSTNAETAATAGGLSSCVYIIKSVTQSGRYSNATLDNPSNSNGLVWKSDELGSVAFHGFFPESSSVNGVLEELQGNKYISFTGMTIPASPTLTWSSDGKTGSPDMQYAYLISAPATPDGESGTILLDFHPLFNAFEIDLASKDKSLTLKQFVLSSSSSKLGGTFSYDGSEWINHTSPVISGVDVTEAGSSTSIQIDLTGKTIGTGSDQHLKFTFLTLPGALTDLSLAVTYVDPLDGTKERTRSLKLMKNGSDIEFAPFTKARIYGLAVEDGFRFFLDPAYVDALDNFDHVINY